MSDVITACLAAAIEAGGLPTVFGLKLKDCAIVPSIDLPSAWLVGPPGLPYGDRYTLEGVSGDLCGRTVFSLIEA